MERFDHLQDALVLFLTELLYLLSSLCLILKMRVDIVPLKNDSKGRDFYIPIFVFPQPSAVPASRNSPLITVVTLNGRSFLNRLIL